MTEIDQQVRDEIRRVNDGWPGERQFDLDLAEEAADEITRLRAENSRMREALEEIVRMDEVAIVDWKKGDGWLHQKVARAALTPEKETEA